MLLKLLLAALFVASTAIFGLICMSLTWRVIGTLVCVVVAVCYPKVMVTPAVPELL